MIAAAFARTYNHPSYEDPYAAIQDYNRVVEAAAKHPNKGSTALSRIVELPRSRIRGWVDEDGMPDAARGLMVAQRHSWVDPDPETSEALAALAGHLLGGGSITEETYVPSVAAGRQVSLVELEDAFRNVGVRPTRRNEDVESRATEVLPATHGSVLGRTLVAWGCPAGGRKSVEDLPKIVDYAGEPGQIAFIKSYIRHRAVNYRDKATTRLHGQQPSAFHQAIANLIEQVTGETATVGNTAVTVSADAMRALDLVE